MSRRDLWVVVAALGAAAAGADGGSPSEFPPLGRAGADGSPSERAPLGRAGADGGSPSERAPLGRTAADGSPYERVPASLGPAAVYGWRIAGLGGYTKGHGAWDGYAARLEGGGGGGAFSVLAPLGGCGADAGNLSKTSATAAAAGCDYAVNASPFVPDTGACLGQSFSNGTAICPACAPTAEPALGLSTGVAPEWVLGEISADTAADLGLTEVAAGHAGWLVRGGANVANATGSATVAPRTAIGVDASGSLLLLEVDGCEQCRRSRGGPQGLTLVQLADAMLDLGALHAINLDGGGSSATAVNGTVLDFPTDTDSFSRAYNERAVSTVVCVRAPLFDGGQGGRR